MLFSVLAWAFSISTALILALGVLRRKTLSARHVVALNGLLCVSILGALPMWIYRWQGEELIEEGHRNLYFAEQLIEMEEYLASDARESFSEDSFRVCVLGDSTHAFEMPPDRFMIPNLRRIINEHWREDIEIFGFHSAGVDAYHFYLVLHRLIQEDPDLIVVPVNLRVFGDNWSKSRRFEYPSLQRYVPIFDYPVVLALSSEYRQFEWDGMLLYRWDHLFFDDRSAPFLAGIRKRFGNSQERLFKFVEDSASDYMTPLSALTDAPPLDYEENLRGSYTPRLIGTHYMLKQFRELNRYAGEHGAHVLYYAVQTPVRRARQKVNFQMIERNLLRDPGVSFANLSQVLDSDQFSIGEHPTERGLGIVSGHLAKEIVALRDPLLARRARGK